jgi:hypothetical protein
MRFTGVATAMEASPVATSSGGDRRHPIFVIGKFVIDIVIFLNCPVAGY